MKEEKGKAAERPDIDDLIFGTERPGPSEK